MAFTIDTTWKSKHYKNIWKPSIRGISAQWLFSWHRSWHHSHSYDMTCCSVKKELVLRASCFVWTLMLERPLNYFILNINNLYTSCALTLWHLTNDFTNATSIWNCTFIFRLYIFLSLLQRKLQWGTINIVLSNCSLQFHIWVKIHQS